MNIDKLEVGMTVKNYKELCSMLGEKVKTGKAKQYQLKEWNRYFNYIKECNKYTIIEIHEDILPKEDDRGKKMSVENLAINRIERRYHNLFCKEEYLMKSIYSNDVVEIYCDSCNHKYVSKMRNVCQSKLRCRDCSMSKGAKRVLNMLKENDIDFETEFTFDNLRSEKDRLLRFDFAVLKQGNLQFLIEYDGEYHDEKLNNNGSYDIIRKHDEMKDVYCENNSIHLIRIPHTVSNIEEYLANKINEIGLGNYNEYIIKLKERCILEKIKYHHNMIDKLNKELNELNINN